MSLTRQEVFQALADDKVVEVKSKSDPITAFTTLDFAGWYCNLNPHYFHEYDWRIKGIWYEDIPKYGILAWSNTGKLLHIVSFDEISNTVITTNGTYFSVNKVTPLTDEEVKRFLMGESNGS